MILDGKVAYVTGSTRGIGWETALTLARDGARVVLNGHSDRSMLEARLRELSASTGADAMAVFCDVGDRAQVDEAYQAILKRYKRLDILVNNAGVLEEGLLGMISEDAMRATLATNTIGVMHNLQAAARLMGRNRSGSIINVGSIMGTRGHAGYVLYSASKAAVLGMTWSAAKELAPRNIRVNAVAPGFIDTDMVRHLTPAVFEARVSTIGLGRAGTATDVANAILFLASDLAGYITGQVIGVDGGMLV